jgi:hypothetical protein
LISPYKDEQVTRYVGFPFGNTADTTSNGFADQDFYTIRQGFAILRGNASSSIFDTSLYSDIAIEIFRCIDTITFNPCFNFLM